jgi:CheY-like chemotaxis protein
MKSKKKILIVEDDGLVVNIVSYLLEKEGFDIVVAKDGNEGIEVLEIENPDLILMDLVLPYRSGLEVTSLAKQKFPYTPIIVVSSLGLIDETIQEALNLGVSGVVSKPFLPSDLITKIKSTLNL